MERLWKVIDGDRRAVVSGTRFVYPADGEWTRRRNKIGLCERGYHFCRGKQVLEWLTEGLLAEVEADGRVIDGDTKSVAERLRVVRTFPLTARVLRLFAADCAERALLREREAGCEPAEASWRAVEVARRFAVGEATEKELADAADAAWYVAAADAAAWSADATWAAAWSADATWAAAWSSAAYYAAAAYAADAWAAERDWQYRRLLELAGAA